MQLSVGCIYDTKLEKNKNATIYQDPFTAAAVGVVVTVAAAVVVAVVVLEN